MHERNVHMLKQFVSLSIQSGESVKSYNDGRAIVLWSNPCPFVTCPIFWDLSSGHFKLSMGACCPAQCLAPTVLHLLILPIISINQTDRNWSQITICLFQNGLMLCYNDNGCFLRFISSLSVATTNLILMSTIDFQRLSMLLHIGWNPKHIGNIIFKSESLSLTVNVICFMFLWSMLALHEVYDHKSHTPSPQMSTCNQSTLWYVMQMHGATNHTCWVDREKQETNLSGSILVACFSARPHCL